MHIPELQELAQAIPQERRERGRANLSGNHQKSTGNSLECLAVSSSKQAAPDHTDGEFGIADKQRDSRSEYLRKKRSVGRRMYIYVICGTNCANHQAPTLVRSLPRRHTQQTLKISFPIPGSSPSELFPASFTPGEAAREPSQAAISLRLTQYQILLLPLLTHLFAFAILCDGCNAVQSCSYAMRQPSASLKYSGSQHLSKSLKAAGP